MEHSRYCFLIGLTYFIGAWIGVHLTSVAGGIAIIWPPNAILLAALLSSHLRRWPLLIFCVLVAEILADISVFSLDQALLFGLVNVFEASLSVFLLWYLSKRTKGFFAWERPEGVVAFLVVVLGVTTPLAALGGASVNFFLVGRDAEFFTLWKLWWFGDATGLVTLTPFIVGLLKGYKLKLTLEYSFIFLLSFFFWSLFMLFDSGLFSHFSVAPMILCLPIIWSAVRVGRFETITLAVMLALATIILSSMGLGSLIQESDFESVLITQEFVVIFLTLAYLITAFASELIKQADQLSVFKQSLESITEGVVITRSDQDQEILFCNKAFQDISGYQENEILGRNCRFLNQYDRDQPGLIALKKAIQHKVPIDVTLLNSRKNGEKFWNKVSIVPVDDVKAKTSYFCGIQQDITEMVNRAIELEQLVNERTLQLETERERFALASDVSGLGIWEWNIKSGELIWDERMHQIYETTTEDRANNMVYDLWARSVHPDDIKQASESLALAVERKQSWRNEFRLKMPDARVKYIKASAVYYCSSDGETEKMIGGNMDVTEHKQLEQNLRLSAKEAQASNLAKSQFLANMSHEIRTPMNGVLGIAELMSATELSAQQKEYLAMIQNSASLLLRILNDVLDLSKIESGKMKLEKEVFHLEEYIGDIVKGFAVSAHAKNLDLHYYFSPNVPKWVEADPTRIGQVVFNLVGNAIKFTNQGQVSIHIDCENTTKTEKRLIIKIHDTGIGISGAMRQEIFQPFQQADGSITRKYGGTGLGLTIVSELIKLMSGSITLESELGKGSDFVVNLPITEVDEQAQGRPSEPGKLLKIVQFLQQCLIVDDNPINQRWLQDMVHGWGGQATIAASAEQALELMAEADKRGLPFKIMFLDKHMPVKSGFDLLEMMKTKGLTKPKVVIMLSSSNPSCDIAEAKALGVDQYLLKPVKQSEVYDALISLIEGGERQSHLSLNVSADLGQPEKSLKILVAEDNEVNQRILKDILEARNHQVKIVENGQLAIDTLRQETFDLVLMDVQMPFMGGLEATEIIRRMEKQKQIPVNRIIALTAHALKGDKEKCLDAGMDDYLTKPVFADKLIRVVEANVGHGFPDEDQPSVSKQECMVNPAWQYFDYSKGMLSTGGKTELVIAIVSMLLEHIPVLREKLNVSLAAGEYEQSAVYLHKLKGMISSVSSEAMQACLSEFESQLENHESTDWDKVDTQLTGFLSELTDFLGG